jgi:hypothetical protein
MRLSRALALAVSLLVVAAPSAASASTDIVSTVTKLPLVANNNSHSASNDLLVDAGRGHVFVSGAVSHRVVEMSLSGQVLASKAVKDGAGGLARIGGTLFVGSCSHPVITTYSASTFAKTGTFSVRGTNPCRLTAGAGKLWYASDDPQTLLYEVDAKTHKSAKVAAAQTGQRTVFVAPSTLYVAGSGVLEKLDVSGATPVQVASISRGFTTTDLAASPDGSTVAVADGSDTFLYDTNLNNTFTLPVGVSVAFSPDGNWVGATTGIGFLYVYPTGSFTPRMVQNIGGLYGPGPDMGHHLAFSPDSTQTYGLYDDVPQTWPAHAMLQIDTVPGTPSYASAIDFNHTGGSLGGTLNLNTFVSTAPVGGAAGRTVDLVLTDPQGHEIDGGQATTDFGGEASFVSPVLGLTGHWSFQVTVEASDPYRAASSEGGFDVYGAVTVPSLTRSDTSVIYGNSETLTAHLSAYQANTTQVEIHKVANGTDTTIASGPVDASGNLATTFTPSHSAKYYAAHPSDDTYSVGSSTPVAVGVIPIINGKWASRHGTSGSYATFSYHSSCATRGTKCPQ